jgi:hypothetical protein
MTPPCDAKLRRPCRAYRSRVEITKFGDCPRCRWQAKLYFAVKPTGATGSELVFARAVCNNVECANYGPIPLDENT